MTSLIISLVLVVITLVLSIIYTRSIARKYATEYQGKVTALESSANKDRTSWETITRQEIETSTKDRYSESLSQWKEEFTRSKTEELTEEANTAVEQWKSNFQDELRSLADKQAKSELDSWRTAEVKKISQEAIKKSKAVRNGKIIEHFLPFSDAFEYNPLDARFLGSPIDLLIFDGLDDDDVQQVVFIEVKTGKSALSKRERSVRDAIKEGRVDWQEIRITTEE